MVYALIVLIALLAVALAFTLLSIATLPTNVDCSKLEKDLWVMAAEQSAILVIAIAGLVVFDR